MCLFKYSLLSLKPPESHSEIFTKGYTKKRWYLAVYSLEEAKSHLLRIFIYVQSCLNLTLSLFVPKGHIWVLSEMKTFIFWCTEYLDLKLASQQSLLILTYCKSNSAWHLIRLFNFRNMHVIFLMFLFQDCPCVFFFLIIRTEIQSFFPQ